MNIIPLKVHRQSIASLLSLMVMKQNELNTIMGKNLKRLRIQAGFTQEYLGELLSALSIEEKEVTQGLIARWESGEKGFGKKVIINLCKIFKNHPYEFYLEPDTPLPITDIERKALFAVREAEKMGLPHVAEESCEYIIHRLQKIKKGGNIENYSGVK